jgi:16S rRNA (adenine1518-N6/adenine1519-N6)-dimethyltransferase
MLTTKKSLGQHFLKDEEILQRIVSVIREKPFKRPGGGALTKHLLSIPDIDFRCIEIDREKVAWLGKTFPSLINKIIEADILQSPQPFDEPFTVVGNFPYNISSQIVFKMLEWREYVDTMVGMFQKEVAERIAAKEGSKVYGVTSVLVQAFFKVEYLFEVGETAFDPPPKVKSAVIRFTPLAHPVRVKTERAFRNLVKMAFGQRRKTLRNAVRGLFNETQLQNEIFNRRAEQLSVAEFAALSFEMN